jgi:hypothetical protein
MRDAALTKRLQVPIYVPEDDEADEDMRDGASRLWAEDWDCPEDSTYDDL